MTLRILIIEDVEADFVLLVRHLRQHGLAVECQRAAQAEQVEAALQQGGWHLVLADYQLPGLDFQALLQRLRGQWPELPVILVTGTIGEERAVDLMREGVSDFVLKDRLGRLVPAIQRSLAAQAERQATAAAQQALADSEAWNRTLLASLADGVFVAQDEHFVFANPALAAMVDWPLAEFIGLPFSSVLSPHDLPLWTERFRHRMATSGPGGGDEPVNRYEVRFETPTGRLLWIELRVSRFQYQGRPAALGVVRDVTDKRQAAAELERHREHLEALVEERTLGMAAANRAKSSFLAHVSHEIRTPLNAIIGMTHLLRRGVAPAQAGERLGTIDTAAHHLLDIVTNVLDLARIESGKLTLEQIGFDLDALLARTCDLVAEGARSKGLALRVDNTAPALTLRGDPTRVSQALLNLLSNAVKFTEHGAVTLRCERLPHVVDPAHPDALWLRFEVADTGVGIPPERQAAIFNAYEQADATTARLHGGSGLGLAITRELARLMGGDAGLSSTPGQGSRFWFSARFDQGANQATLPTPPPPDDAAEATLRRLHTGRRVLLAEDNPVNQMVAVALLNAVGLVADLASNGAEAVDQARSGRHSLVLMDMQMPELNGLQATQALRALPGMANLPIIAMTANATAADRTACLAVGMSDFLAKPVEPYRLYQTLLRWLPPHEAPP